MQRSPSGIVQLLQINMPMLRIPKAEAPGTFECQLSPFIESMSGRVEAKPLDPPNVMAGTGVLHAAIRAPDAEHVFSGGHGCRGHRWRLLASHDGPTPLNTQP
jgi:hypothetical protein